MQMSKNKLFVSCKNLAVVLLYMYSRSFLESGIACVDPESFARGGPTQIFFENRIQIRLKASHHQLVSKTTFWQADECWLDSFRPQG